MKQTTVMPKPRMSGRAGGLFQHRRAFFDPASGALNLTAGKWIVRPHNYMTANVSGNLDPTGQIFAGRILGPAGCSNIVLARIPSPRPLPNACERGLP